VTAFSHFAQSTSKMHGRNATRDCYVIAGREMRFSLRLGRLASETRAHTPTFNLGEHRR
jgi:hypothetical protein